MSQIEGLIIILFGAIIVVASIAARSKNALSFTAFTAAGLTLLVFGRYSMDRVLWAWTLEGVGNQLMAVATVAILGRLAWLAWKYRDAKLS